MPPISSSDQLESIPLTREEIQEGYDTSLLSLPERHSTSNSTLSSSSSKTYALIVPPPMSEVVGTRKAAEGYERRAREVESRRGLLAGSGERDGDGEEETTEEKGEMRNGKLIGLLILLGVLMVVGVGLGAGLGMGLFGKDKDKDNGEKEGEGEGKEVVVSAKVEVSSVGESGGSTVTSSEVGWEPTPVGTTEWWNTQGEATTTSDWDEVVPAHATSAGGGNVEGEWEGAGDGIASWNAGETGGSQKA